MIPFVQDKMRLNKFKNVFIPRNKDLYLQFKPSAKPFEAGTTVDIPMSKNQCYQSLIDKTIHERKIAEQEAARKAAEQKQKENSEKSESQSE